MSVRRFQEDMNFWIGRLRKITLPSLTYRWTSSSLLRAWIEQKGRWRVNLLSLLELRHLSSALRHWCISSQVSNQDLYTTVSTPFTSTPSPVLRLWIKVHCQCFWVSSLQTADHGTSQPPWLHQSIPVLNPLVSSISILFSWRTQWIHQSLYIRMPLTIFLVLGECAQLLLAVSWLEVHLWVTESGSE